MVFQNILIEVESDLNVQLYLPEDDFNSKKSTLFATYLWSESPVLARKLLQVLKNVIGDSSMLEFGAATGLPFIVVE